MKIAYFGKKRPKVVEIDTGADPVTGEPLKTKVTFEPFKETEVPDEIGRRLLENAPDIFKRTDGDERKPLARHKPSTDGYVGDAHASQIPDLDKTRAADKRAEEGKDIDQVIEETLKEEKRNKRKIISTPSAAPEDDAGAQDPMPHKAKRRIKANER